MTPCPFVTRSTTSSAGGCAWAIVNRAMEGRPGLIVIAALNGDALVKRLAKEGEQIVLRAENQAYAPRYVLEGDELLIWGVVTQGSPQNSEKIVR